MRHRIGCLLSLTAVSFESLATRSKAISGCWASLSDGWMELVDAISRASQGTWDKKSTEPMTFRSKDALRARQLETLRSICFWVSCGINRSARSNPIRLSSVGDRSGLVRQRCHRSTISSTETLLSSKSISNSSYAWPPSVLMKTVRLGADTEANKGSDRGVRITGFDGDYYFKRLLERTQRPYAKQGFVVSKGDP